MKRNDSDIPSPLAPRRAAVMIAAAICLLLATVLLASVLRMAVTARQQVRREQLRVQAEWLAESGLERAAARLAADAAYRGESWNIPAGELDGRREGQVVIAVAAAAGSAKDRIVTIEATFPSGGAGAAKRTRRARVQAASE